MPIAADPATIAKMLVDAGRSEGVETAVQAALDIVHFRWLKAEAVGSWETFAASLISRESSWSSSGEIGVEAADRLPAPIRLHLVTTLDVIASDHGQDEELRQFLHLIFEEILRIRVSRVGRAGTIHSTDSSVARLMSSVAGYGMRVLDPACGLGTSLLLSAGRQRDLVVGFEIDEQIAITTEARFELAGVEAHIVNADWFHRSDNTWDSIVFEPPFSVTLSESQLAANPGLPPKMSRRSDLVWIFKALDSLRDGGSAVVLLPSRTLSSQSDRASRQELLDLGLIEAIVSLPAGASLGTGIETALWIMRKSPAAKRSGEVLMVNAAQLFAGSEADKAEEELRLSSEILKWRADSTYRPDISWRAGVVSHATLSASPSFSPRVHLPLPPETTEVRPTAPVRLLSELHLEGFKAVDASMDVPLRPLTLIYGRNSAGKSSLIQAMLLLRQSIGSSNLVTRGEDFDLGSFRGLVHQHQTSRGMRLGLTFGSSPATDSALGVIDPSRVRTADLTFTQGATGAAQTNVVDISIGSEQFTFRRVAQGDDQFELTADDAVRLVEVATGPGFAYPSRKPSTDAHLRVKRALRRLGVDKLTFPSRGSVPADAAATDFEAVSQGTTRQGIEASDLRRGTNAVASVTRELQALLERTVYLGPLRQAPQRVSVRQDSSRIEIDIPFYLLDNKSERDELSKWLQRLGMRYNLDVLSLASAPGAHVLGDIASIVLTNERTKVTLSTADVGFGVSQVLPILVELSARRDSIILIEQPEIHLHPAMQSELADLLIESSDEAGRGNQIIAETHSEHLMLRVQRRIREGQLDPDQVSIIYVDQDENGAALATQLRVDARGEFLDDWPNGFFSERFDEVFGGLL